MTLLAASLTSCKLGYTDLKPPMRGFTPHEVYVRGYNHGRTDSATGRPYNPHINDSENLSSAYRKDYLWGYAEGYKGSVLIGVDAYSTK